MRHAQVTGGLGLGAVALKRLSKDLGLDLLELLSQIAILELQSNGPGSFWRSVRVRSFPLSNAAARRRQRRIVRALTPHRRPADSVV